MTCKVVVSIFTPVKVFYNLIALGRFRTKTEKSDRGSKPR